MICVIGGSGFIGTHLCRVFSAKCERFLILDKKISPEFQEFTQKLDIRQGERIAQHLKGDSIIHLAAEHRDNVSPKSLYHEVNVEGMRNVCAAASQCGINRIIFTSSVAVYGFTEGITDENGAIDPFSEYGKTKYAAEQILQAWAAEDPTVRSVTIVRPTVVFGPGNRGNVFNLFQQIARRRFLMIGSGENIKSLAFVENIADFLHYSLSFGPGVRIFNYVDEPSFSMNELVSTTRAIMFGNSVNRIKIPYTLGLMLGHLADLTSKIIGRSLPLSSIRVRKFCSDTHFSSRISEHQGFVPRVSLEDGIRKTIELDFLAEQSYSPIFHTE